MKTVIQRVSNASVTIENTCHAEIGQGLLLFVGIEDEDNQDDIQWLCNKIAQLRIFNDMNHTMNLSIQDIQGQILIISQFTLHASTKKGNRPSYIKASKPEIAIPLYENFIATMKKTVSLPVKSGIFGADMKINLINDGPVTILIDTKNKF